MRGNEAERLLYYRRQLGEFQIPMRGNEIREAERVTVTFGQFQIPMRGNEAIAERRARGSLRVSNPHEG